MDFNLLAESRKDGFSPIRKSTSRGGQWNGACILPSCNGLGHDRLRIQPNKGDYGWFFCSVCSASGTGIDWLIIKRGWSKNEALKYVGWKPRDGSTPRFAIPRHALTGDIHPTHEAPREEWQSSAKAFVTYCEGILWSEQGHYALEYLRARGLKDETIKAARLGYNSSEMLRPGGKWGREKLVKLWQGIVIPWFVNEGEIWRITIRDEQASTPEDRYKQVAGGSNGLYMAFSLHIDRPVVITEGEFDALSIAQECGKAVSVVATGTTEGSHIAKWLCALAQKDLVLVAFDADQAGDNAAKWWLDRLECAHRIRPWWDDPNQMLQDGVDLLNDWILPFIASIKTSQINTDECGLCAVCLDLGKETAAALEYEELMYCAEHYPHTRKLETFVSRLQQEVPQFGSAKIEYWRKEDWPRMKERITHERMASMPQPDKPSSKLWDIINDLEKAGKLPEPQPVIYPNFWQSLEKRLAVKTIPNWLIPGEDEWNALVARVGLKEAKERRQKALKQIEG